MPVLLLQNESEAQPTPFMHVCAAQVPVLQVAPAPGRPHDAPSEPVHEEPSASGLGTQRRFKSAKEPLHTKSIGQAALVVQSSAQTPSPEDAVQTSPLGQLDEPGPVQAARHLPPRHTDEVPSGPQRSPSRVQAVSRPVPTGRQAWAEPYQSGAQTPVAQVPEETGQAFRQNPGPLPSEQT
jgi:hypothetical protein